MECFRRIFVHTPDATIISVVTKSGFDLVTAMEMLLDKEGEILKQQLKQQQQQILLHHPISVPIVNNDGQLKSSYQYPPLGTIDNIKNTNYNSTNSINLNNNSFNYRKDNYNTNSDNNLRHIPSAYTGVINSNNINNINNNKIPQPSAFLLHLPFSHSSELNSNQKPLSTKNNSINDNHLSAPIPSVTPVVPLPDRSSLTSGLPSHHNIQRPSPDYLSETKIPHLQNNLMFPSTAETLSFSPRQKVSSIYNRKDNNNYNNIDNNNNHDVIIKQSASSLLKRPYFTQSTVPDLLENSQSYIPNHNNIKRSYVQFPLAPPSSHSHVPSNQTHPNQEKQLNSITEMLRRVKKSTQSIPSIPCHFKQCNDQCLPEQLTKNANPSQSTYSLSSPPLSSCPSSIELEEKLISHFHNIMASHSSNSNNNNNNSSNEQHNIENINNNENNCSTRRNMSYNNLSSSNNNNNKLYFNSPNYNSITSKTISPPPKKSVRLSPPFSYKDSLTNHIVAPTSLYNQKINNNINFIPSSSFYPPSVISDSRPSKQYPPPLYHPKPPVTFLPPQQSQLPSSSYGRNFVYQQHQSISSSAENIVSLSQPALETVVMETGYAGRVDYDATATAGAFDENGSISSDSIFPACKFS